MIAGPRITALYVPGNRPDRFDKAVASGSQVIILDLEDAVAPADKEAARERIESWFLSLTPGARPIIQVRVNARDTEWREADLRMIGRLAAKGAVEVRLPKVEHAAELDNAAELIGGVPISALIETAVGLENVSTIARHPAVSAVALGDSDLAGDLGSTSTTLLDWARIRLVVAARAARLPAPMMSVYPNLRDLAGLESDTARGRSLGLLGRTAAHPAQLSPIVRAFSPTAAELEWADEVRRALDAASNGVSVLASGAMVDAAMAARAADIGALHSAIAAITAATE